MKWSAMPPSSSLMYLRSHNPASVSISSRASSTKRLELSDYTLLGEICPVTKVTPHLTSQIHPRREATVGWVDMTLD